MAKISLRPDLLAGAAALAIAGILTAAPALAGQLAANNPGPAPTGALAPVGAQTLTTPFNPALHQPGTDNGINVDPSQGFMGAPGGDSQSVYEASGLQNVPVECGNEQQIYMAAYQREMMRLTAMSQAQLAAPPSVGALACLGNILKGIGNNTFFNLPTIGDIINQATNAICSLAYNSVQKAIAPIQQRLQFGTDGFALPGGIWVPGATGGVSLMNGSGQNTFTINGQQTNVGPLRPTTSIAPNGEAIQYNQPRPPVSAPPQTSGSGSSLSNIFGIGGP